MKIALANFRTLALKGAAARQNLVNRITRLRNSAFGLHPV